jgi:hypothetical protein
MRLKNINGRLPLATILNSSLGDPTKVVVRFQVDLSQFDKQDFEAQAPYLDIELNPGQAMGLRYDLSKMQLEWSDDED